MRKPKLTRRGRGRGCQPGLGSRGSAPPCAEPGCHLPVSRPVPEGPGLLSSAGLNVQPKGVISAKTPVRRGQERVLTAEVSGHPGKSFFQCECDSSLGSNRFALQVGKLPDAASCSTRGPCPAQASLGPQKDGSRSPNQRGSGTSPSGRTAGGERKWRPGGLRLPTRAKPGSQQDPAPSQGRLVREMSPEAQTDPRPLPGRRRRKRTRKFQDCWSGERVGTASG